MVERSSDVINLVWPYIKRPGWEVIYADLNDVLDGLDEQFDLVLLDTWPSGDYLFLPWVESLRKRAKHLQAPGGETWLWMYSAMLRALRQDLERIAATCQDAVVRPMPDYVLAGLRKRWPYFAPLVEWCLSADRSSAAVDRKISQEVELFRQGKRGGYTNTMKADLLEPATPWEWKPRALEEIAAQEGW